jgi:hypothetical protein
VREKRGVGARILLELEVEASCVRALLTDQLALGPSLRRRRSGAFAMPPFRRRGSTASSGSANAADLSPERLDAIGAPGWELAAATPAGDGLVLFFKRQCASAY